MDSVTQKKNKDISSLFSVFKKTSLQDLNKVALLNRSDKKFVFHREKLFPLLNDLLNYYYILDIDGIVNHPYKSVYFDTDNFHLFHNHQRGKSNRYKFRTREYSSTGIAFNEIKFKNNKGKTSKVRLKRSLFKSHIDEKFSELISLNSNISPNALKPSLLVYFNRLTLTDFNFTERLTIDLNLSFKTPCESINKDYSDLIILELKQDKSANKSDIDSILLKHRIFATGNSKYCLGIYSTQDDIKRNQFKSKHKNILKILNSTGETNARN